MKSFISLLSLYVRASAKKALAIIAVITALDLVLAWAIYSGNIEGMQGPITSETGRILYNITMAAARTQPYINSLLILMFGFSLASDHICTKGRSNYTMSRLGHSRRGLYWTKVLANVMYCLLLWFSRGVCAAACLRIQDHYTVMHYGSIPASPQRLYLSLISDVYRNIALPLNNTTVWIAVPLMILTVSLVSAGAHQRLLRAQTEEQYEEI